MNTSKENNSLPFWSQLRWTLIFGFVGIAVLPVVLVMGIALLRARENTSNQVFSQLTSISDLKKNQIRQWLEGAQTSLEQIVAAPTVKEQFLLFANTSSENSEFFQTQNNLSELLQNVTDTNSIFKEIFFYRADGTVIAASNPVQIGKLVTFQPYYEASLLGDYVQTPYYGIGSNELVMYISHALFDADGDKIQAVLAGQLDMTVLGNIMTDRTGLGDSGETYLVSSESNYLITPSRFESEGYIQARSYRSEGIDRALQGQEGFGFYDNYRSANAAVLGVYGWIPELQAGILAEIDESEGLLGYFETRNTYLLVAFLGATLAGIAGFYTANRISRPITQLTETAVNISQGNLEQTVEITSKNEIGILAGTFNSMTRQIRDFLNTLERRVADRTKALITSAEVSRRLSNILDPNQLVLQVVEQVQEAFNYYHAHIYLLDEATQTLKMAGGTGEVGKILLERGHAIPIERGLVGRAARTKSVVWVPETLKEEGWLPNPLLPETKSEIAVPIVLGDTILGVLDVQNNVANSLTQDDADLLQAIANQVAVGLQNARQYAQTQRLYQAGVALLGANDPQTILKTLMLYAAPQADQAGLLLFERTEEDDRIKYIKYEANWSREADFKSPIEIGTLFSPEQVPFITHLSTGQTLVIANRETETLFPEDVNILSQFGLQSIVGLPLIYAGKTIGALLFGYNETHQFTVDELQPVQTLSNQIVILLQNLSLYEQTQMTLAQLDVLNRRLIGQGWQDYAKISGGITIEDKSPTLDWDNFNSQISSENGHSRPQNEMIVPIAVRGHEIGLFRVEQMLEHDLTEQDFTLIQEVANEIAVSLENIRLIEQTQQNAAALEESRNLLDSVVENLPLLLFVKEAKELRYVRWNKAGEEMLGISAPEVMGKNAYDSFSKEEADRFTAQDWEILSGEKFLDIAEETVETPRGTRILHTRKTPVFGPDGQARFLIGLSEDITERKQSEQAIRDLEALYRRAIAAADAVPYSRQYSDESFTFVGEKILDLTGYTPEEFTTSLFDAILLETNIYSAQNRVHTEAVQITRSGHHANWKAEYRIRRRDGQERWLSDTSIEIMGPDGTSTGSVGILTDITERKHAEETLNRQLQEMENLNAIGQIVVTQQNLDTLLALSGQKICQAFNVDSGYVALYNPRSKMLQIPFYQDMGRQLQLEPQPLGIGLASRIVDTGQPLLLAALTPEIAEEAGAFIVEGQVPASWLGVPILAGEEVLGVINVQHPTEPYWFQDSDAQFLSTIAATLSTAIQNIRLFEQTQNTLAQLENLTRRLTHESWQNYLESMPGQIGYVYDLNRVEPITTSGALPQDNGIIEQPLTVQGETIGKLVLAETEELDEEDHAVLSAVSKQLSAHIENLRLLEETERSRFELDKRAAELTTVAEVATATATLLNPDELLQTVVDLTKSSFGLYHAHIYLLNENNDTLILSNGAGEVGYQMVLKGWHIPITSERSLVARAARSRKGVLTNDVQTAPDFLPNPLLPNTRSELAVPLFVGDRVLGVLDVQSDQLNFYTDEDIQIYSTLASQIAVALQNARLYVEQAATVQRLRELDHLKSSFLANMSHELRTPLNSIIGFTEIILEGIDGPLTEFMDGDLKIIQKNGKHLLSLINDVLDMAKIEAGRMNLTYERFMLSELMDDVMDITSSLAHDKQLYMRVESEDGSETELLADRIRLRQVLINIVGNAIKFTERGGITLRSEKKDGKLWLKIKDTGIGIPPNKLDAIFEAFSQVDTSTTRKAGGTGLGLPISRRLVELHQGQLYAESSGIEGEGSTFYLVLPLENMPVA